MAHFAVWAPWECAQGPGSSRSHSSLGASGQWKSATGRAPWERACGPDNLHRSSKPGASGCGG
eukprot:1677501-Alexandrium_andersonii.AAC.1